MNKAIFDIGGNAVKYKINNQKIKSFSTIGKDKKFVLENISKIIIDNKSTHVGIASPCGVDSKTGELHGISGIKNYGNFNLYNELKYYIGKKIKVIAHNDANAALLGNLVNKNFSSAAQITIGTGIGGAIYFNNQIISGHKGMSGEFGYTPFNKKHNISQSCSANALVRQINKKHNKKFKNFESIIVSKINFKKELENWSKNVAILISQVFFFLSPEVLFISGGITKNLDIQKYILRSFKKLMNDFNYKFEYEIEFRNIKNPAIVGLDKELDKN